MANLILTELWHDGLTTKHVYSERHAERNGFQNIM